MLTSDRNEAAIQLWIGGTRVQEIADRIGVTRSAVYQWLTKAQAAGTCPRERLREAVRATTAGRCPRPVKYNYTCTVCLVRGRSTEPNRLYCGPHCRRAARWQREKQRRNSA